MEIRVRSSNSSPLEGIVAAWVPFQQRFSNRPIDGQEWVTPGGRPKTSDFYNTPSALTVAVVRVLLICSEEQMLWIATRRIVASVTDTHSMVRVMGRDTPYEQFVHHTRDLLILSSHFDSSITLLC